MSEMSDFKYKCGVCLQPKEVLRDLLEADSSNESWTCKLQFIVPEVEWPNTLKICSDCAQRTDQICEFRRMCIKVDEERQQIALNCHKSDDDSDNHHQSEGEPSEDRFSLKCEESSESRPNFEDDTIPCIVKLDEGHEPIAANYQDSDDNNCKSEEEDQQTTLTCLKCRQSFETQQLLDDHTSTCQAQKYGCSHCHTYFRSKTILAKHIRDKHRQSLDLLASQKDKKYTCEKCNKGYVFQKPFAEHIAKCEGVQVHPDTKNVGFECDICHKFYTTWNIMRAHRKKCSAKASDSQDCARERSNSDSVFTCEICAKEMTFVKSVIDHCVAEHSMDPKLVKPYSCSECSIRFSSSAGLADHKRYHEGIRTNICSFCGKSYITRRDLRVHELIHLNRRDYKCKTCGKAFNTRHNLRTHMLGVHTDRSEWKYVCSTCGKRFPANSDYKQHLRRHTGEKVFSCPICNKRFVTRPEVKIHMESHSSVRPFKCEHCNNDYKKKNMLDQHLAKAHNIGEAKITIVKVCSVCGKTFHNNARLREHMCAHTGIRPFECNLCGKRFIRKYHLNQHSKTTHNVQQAEDTMDRDLKD